MAMAMDVAMDEYRDGMTPYMFIYALACIRIRNEAMPFLSIEMGTKTKDSNQI
jgi:hypothetical protein